MEKDRILFKRRKSIHNVYPDWVIQKNQYRKKLKKKNLFSHFYGTTDETSINKTRYKNFYKEQTLELHQLPPTKDELTQHIWANYQACVWKRALEISIDIPSIIGHGWDRKDDQLSTVCMGNQPVQESMLERITCTCRKSYCTNFCQYNVLSMECTDVCKCRGLCGSIDCYSVESNNDEDEEDHGNNNADDNAWNIWCWLSHVLNNCLIYLSYLVDLFSCVQDYSILPIQKIFRGWYV